MKSKKKYFGTRGRPRIEVRLGAKASKKGQGARELLGLLVSSCSLLLAPCPFFLSCSGDTLFHQYKSLPAEGWDRSDTIRFDINETADGRTLFVGLRTKANVGLRDLVLAVEQRDASGSLCHCDTIRYPLTDAEGFSLGKGINRRQYETHSLPLRLPSSEGSIRIHHLMSRELLTGFTELGIRVQK